MRKLLTIVGLGSDSVELRSGRCRVRSLMGNAQYHSGDFKLVSGTRAADILVSPNDFKVVQIAGANLALDVERVTRQKPSMKAGGKKLVSAGGPGRNA